jgi:hypothetical protein
MWRTSEGNRVLTDAEWAVFRVILELLWDFAGRASGYIDMRAHTKGPQRAPIGHTEVSSRCQCVNVIDDPTLSRAYTTLPCRRWSADGAAREKGSVFVTSPGDRLSTGRPSRVPL